MRFLYLSICTSENWRLFFRFGDFIEGKGRVDELNLMNECGNGRIELFYVLNSGADNHWGLLCRTNEIYYY
jgi:hypothetical protein